MFETKFFAEVSLKLSKNQCPVVKTVMSFDS